MEMKYKSALLITAVFLAAVFASGIAAYADTLHFKNGRTLSGKILEERAETVKIKPTTGAAITLQRDFIVSIDYEEDRAPETNTRGAGLWGLIEARLAALETMDHNALFTIMQTVTLAVDLIFVLIQVIVVIIMCLVNKILPLGVKMARASILISNVMTVLIMAVTCAMFFMDMTFGAPSWIMVTILSIQLLMLSVGIWLFVGLGRLSPAARRVQILISIFGLLSIPAGTVFNIVILYSLFRKKNRPLFFGEPAAVSGNSGINPRMFGIEKE